MSMVDMALYTLIVGVVLAGVIGFVIAVWGDRKK